MSKRVRFELLPGETGWDVTRDSVVIANFAVKSIGEQYAVERAQAVQRQHGLAQLVIKGATAKSRMNESMEKTRPT